jgi:hypothetical protein
MQFWVSTVDSKWDLDLGPRNCDLGLNHTSKVSLARNDINETADGRHIATCMAKGLVFFCKYVSKNFKLDCLVDYFGETYV